MPSSTPPAAPRVYPLSFPRLFPHLLRGAPESMNSNMIMRTSAGESSRGRRRLIGSSTFPREIKSLDTSGNFPRAEKTSERRNLPPPPKLIAGQQDEAGGRGAGDRVD
ncbi:hypothetical protein DBV15_09776 [Temnothorax longispinosus]|uniref:Uncharacterized protein n=1 Tax=Temnothorax longispinosus TaxID=300112 RepID=A0A4S2KNL4_9HYME|nr:hypothetical protein DBV15_09776 [Temnothorax longispinosus]